ncbi:uncharacterized protein LOC104901016 [Beta vulgaris subsp. vulgaris]|uniref:uncharacterized protein LOC104901016 n=1 Tax=Beta vulgaris subsp. vulgaris TaxID=3555 RepID=UPI00053F6B76|nr:uncharacterized protein LOC104901016 [Beta vulgaris subsp. vulgaris]
MVNQFGFWDGLEWKWSFVWSRSLRPQDEQELSTLLLVLQHVYLSSSDVDTLMWAPSKSDTFSVKSVSMELAKTNSLLDAGCTKKLWRGLVLHRIEIFTWLVLLEKTNSKAKLARIGIIPASETLYVLCSQFEEDVNHLFLHFSFSHKIRAWWLQLWNMKWVFLFSIRLAFKQWQSLLRAPFIKKVWCAGFFIMIWSIWKERNARCFNQVECNVEQVQNLILLRLSWWIIGWGDPFPYSSTDIVRNPQCLLWSPTRISKHLLHSSSSSSNWSPPPLNSLKWNIDASLNVTNNKTAIGGVLRDPEGCFKCLFSSPIPYMEINHVEVLAIHRALKILLSSPFVGNYGLVVESDSANAVAWCTGENKGPWNLNFHINFIRGLLTSTARLSLVYKGRESNVVADQLAKQGLSCRDEFVAWL